MALTRPKNGYAYILVSSLKRRAARNCGQHGQTYKGRQLPKACPDGQPNQENKR